jgi:hypothetical protein
MEDFSLLTAIERSHSGSISEGASMKARILIFGLVFAAASLAGAQNIDNMVYAKQFPGSTVGAKVAAAQAACNSNTAIPCIIVIDPTLATYPAGTMPTLCSQCALMDFRSGISSVPTRGGTMTGPLFTPEINGVVNGNLSSNLQTAINLAAGGYEIYLPCGTFYGNFTITNSDTTIRGGGRDCTVLYPAADGAPVISINAASRGTTGINHVRISDLSIRNQSGFIATDGIVIEGNNVMAQPNDRLQFWNLYIVGMRNDISILGRTIWTTFQNVVAETAQNDGLYSSTSAAVTFISFRDSRFAEAQNYGIYWNNTNANPSLAITFDHVNIEYNGQSGTLANCAGAYLTGLGQGEITNGSYFEGNCTWGSDTNGADVRLTGTYAQSFSIRDTLMQGTLNSIYNDATLTTGKYDGNYLQPSAGYSIYTATTHPRSHVTIGTNYDNAAHDFVPDSNNLTHVFFEANTDQSGNALASGAFSSAIGQFRNSSTLSVSALSTATVIPSSGEASGLLHIRDNTLGGSAAFIIDPNSGVQLLGTSGVTGLAAAGITFSSGNWHVTLTSGRVPRTLVWAILQ